MFPALGLPILALGASASLLPTPQTIFTNFPSTEWKIPTIRESAVQARRILRLTDIGTLSTVFPSDSTSIHSMSGLETFERRPSGLGGAPIGLMDYYADCEDKGNPTILAISIATSFKNVDSGSNITLSLRWHPQDGKWRSAASLPRFSLIGHLENMDDKDANLALKACFLKSHPDAIAWLPGNRIHESHWVRLVVDEVYWIGGFGDRAYIGWIPTDTWTNVTEEEIGGIRLPGEKEGKGWSMWWSL
ncbi:hypothetical protein K461DRAFT_274641 [Myriangium duriaei CBS 260.36]|uniref:CREG-like beta-barrel domain-containing protein n=1 Tax=Myriangium duriaei CBS 260.36 TaxID=1168546 RepID=A0A9P4JAV5_9PEZI|nr:hypothetical protein K461DRAFT_274641 [Myriangium duriaei CBS 260.36]